MTQESMLFVAALLTFAVGLAHSVLGERFVLMRLFRRTELPKLFGETAFQQAARIDAGRGVTLEVHQVAAMAFMRRIPEVVLADPE